jgi:hypothetical protein
LEKTGDNRRKIILLISDGVNEPKVNKHGYDSVREKLLLNNISVFALGLGWDPESAKLSRLQKYAQVSGGDFYYATKSREMDEIYARITEESRHQYILTYVPKGNKAGVNFHRVDLRTVRNGMKVQTREGYYNNRSGELPKE